MAEGEKPPIDGPVYRLHSHSVDYRRPEGPIVVQLSVLELAPNFPRPGDKPEPVYLIFDTVGEALHHFESLVSHRREFSP